MLEKLSVQPQDFSKVYIPFQMDEKSIPTVSDQFSYFYLAFVSLEEASCCTLGTPLTHSFLSEDCLHLRRFDAFRRSVRIT